MKICPASLVSRELPSASLWDKSHIAAILVRLWSLDVTKRLVYMKEEIWTNLAFSQKVKQHDSTIALLYIHPKGIFKPSLAKLCL